MRILVINEERTTADSLAEVLRRNGHHVFPLYNAIDAVEHAEHLVFDVAILGPTLGSDEVVLGRALRELMPHCKVARCKQRGFAELMAALDAEFEYFPMDTKCRRGRKHASQRTTRGHLPSTHTFKVEELLEQLDEIKIKKAVDASFGSQWNVSPVFIRRRKAV